MTNTGKFNEFEQYMAKEGILTVGAAASYKTYLNNADRALEGRLEIANFAQNKNYLYEVIQSLSEAENLNSSLANIKSALYQLAHFAVAKYNSATETLPNNFTERWLEYAKAAETIKNELQWTGNITGDFGEFLIADVFGYTKARNSERTIDLKDKAGKTYQIKTRKVPPNNMTTSLGICRSLDFDFLISILLASNGTVLKILKHTREELKQLAQNAQNDYQRGYVFVTTQKFQEAGDNPEMLAAVYKKYPKLAPKEQ